MTGQRVTVEITDGVADVRLNRPEKRNALDGPMFAGLVTAGERLKSEPGVRAVVLSGEGRTSARAWTSARSLRSGTASGSAPWSSCPQAPGRPGRPGSAPPTYGRKSPSRSSRP